MKQLSVVVTCTERKIASARPELQVRSLPEGPVGSRVEEWHRRVLAAGDPVTVMDLYQGEHWSKVRELLNVSRVAGFSPKLWVASAGLGLQPVSANFPSYAATFSPRHLDTVAQTGVDRRLWWKGLRRLMDTPSVGDLGGRRSVLLVLSEVYAGVLDAEIRDLASTDAEVVLIGGSSDIAGVHRIPADSALRTALGGTLTGLNARMAAVWLSFCADGRLITSSTKGSWTRWVNQVRVDVRHNRAPMTDAQVKSYIRQTVGDHPGYSRTRLHRMLRDSGRACEQKRFALLFAETVGEK